MSTSRVDVGTPPEKFEGWTTANVCFHGFANLTTTRGERVYSPEFSCFGHQWTLGVYPGGRVDSQEGYVGIKLANFSNTSIKIQYGYSVKDADGKEVVHHESYTEEFDAYVLGNNAWYTNNFAKRSKLLDLLVQGSLVIEVRMKPTSTDKSITQFIPTNPIYKNVLQKFMDEESADVVFEVDNESGQYGEKINNSITLYAHRFILQDISTIMAELCKADEGGVATVSIADVKPKIFKHMIYYAYGGKLSDKELEDNAREIINACDKYGVVHLKLEVEAAYVKSTTFSMDNMMDNLLYADSKNLALLKEAVMDFILANKGDIMGKVSFSNVPGDMMMDLLAAVARGEEPEGEGGRIDYNRMRVGALRKMLDEKGLEVDGSREAMIALLKENNDSDDSNDDDNDEDNVMVEPIN